MLRRIRKIYRRMIAGVMLFTAEAVLTISMFLLSLVAFLAIAKYVFMDKKKDFDQSAFVFLESFIKEDVTHVMVSLSVIGNYQVMTAANLLLTLYFLFIRKHKWYSIKIPAISLSSVLLMSVLKMLFNRQRPIIPLLERARGLSFPSGHAMMSVVFFGLIIYFTYRHVKNPTLKSILISMLVILILSIGISRVYLKVHYASDVIAGFCMGVIWLTIAIKALDRIEVYSRKEINTALEETPEPVES